MLPKQLKERAFLACQGYCSVRGLQQSNALHQRVLSGVIFVTHYAIKAGAVNGKPFQTD
jgi:hypothetical protein